MRWIILAMAVVLAACEANPYKGRPEVQGPQPPPPPAPKPKPPEPKGAWSLDVPDQMEFVEGQNSLYTIKGTVPTNGTPTIIVAGLPAGASYDPVSGALSWTPDFQAANDPNEPLAGARIYTVTVTLTSSASLTESRVKQSLLIVRDTPQPAAIKTSLDAIGEEGQDFVHDIAFDDFEFPAGPFDVTFQGLPAGVELVWPDHRVPAFQLRWKPGYKQVKGLSEEVYTGQLVLYNPRGRRLDFQVHWTVRNAYAAPLASGPEEVAQSGDVDFMMMAEDVNGEEEPQWSAVNAPTDGKFSVSTKAVAGSAAGDRRSLALVSWKQTPKERYGKTFELQLNACVRGNVCTLRTVRIVPSAKMMGAN